VVLGKSIAAIALSLFASLAACSGGGTAGTSATSSPTSEPTSSTRGIAAAAPWVTFYGTARTTDVASAAATFRLFDIDVDPDGGWTDAQLATLGAGGTNRVLSYLNIGSCERTRSYWATVPAGFTSCGANVAAQRGAYAGYPNEVWMNPANPAYQHLIVDYVAARLAARRIDGFYLDNLEIAEHGTATTNGPCDASCRQGGLDLVRMLRARYPELLLVMQNATSDVTRLGVTGGVAFPTLLDGVAHEEVFAPSYDATAEAQLLAWKAMGLRPGGSPLWIGTVDYVGSCSQRRRRRPPTPGAAPTASIRTPRTRARDSSPSAPGDSKPTCDWSIYQVSGALVSPG